MPICRNLKNAAKKWFFVGVCMSGFLLMPSFGFGQGGGPGPGGHSSPSDYYRGSTLPPPTTVLSPHGGHYLSTESNRFEIVFMPLQTRIYVYDKLVKPQSARDLQVQMSLLMPGERTVRKIPFQYITAQAGVDQDYLVAIFEVAPLRGKETPITVEVSNLPNRKQPTVSFTPMLSDGKIRPYVAQVLPVKTDESGVLRQRTCPVSGDVLGVKGPVVKVLIADYPLYLCCEGCIEAVRDEPEKYLPRRPAATAPGR